MDLTKAVSFPEWRDVLAGEREGRNEVRSPMSDV